MYPPKHIGGMGNRDVINLFIEHIPDLTKSLRSIIFATAPRSLAYDEREDVILDSHIGGRDLVFFRCEGATLLFNLKLRV